MMQPKVIGFDADDTLWVNENYFREAENQFCELLSNFRSKESILQELYDVELDNLELYGFGIKGFMLSMTETASRVAGGGINTKLLRQILDIGKEMLDKPVELLDNVEEILQQLQGKYKLVLVTKGDLLDQQRKLEKSGLEPYFHHVEIMSDKKEVDYEKLVKHLDLTPDEFLMIGNSLRSDVLPVLNIGAHAIYVPYAITWQHENVHPDEYDENQFTEVKHLHDILDHIA